MKDYLNQTVDTDDFDLVSVIDDLPLWSAPFGLRLLDRIKMKKGMNVLDVGCGLGFPLLEIAERLGNSCRVIGIDPWEQALERARLKMRIYDIKNVELIHGYAEEMPFESDFFDLIVSNNGINNVNDMNRTMKECYRVAKPNAQVVLTLNLEETMIEFYNVFQEILEENNLFDAIPKMKEQIYSKRKPLAEIKEIIEAAGFAIINIDHDFFKLRFVDGTTMFNHYLIRFWFVGGWKDILEQDDLVPIFKKTESKLNKQAQSHGEIALTIPFVTIDCRKN